MPVLIDTDIAIHLRDMKDDVLVRLGQLEGRPSLSIITVVELEGGIHARPEFTKWRRDRVDAMMRRMIVLPFDGACAAAYSHILATTGYSRRKINDRMIAATALAHDLTLVTINGNDFRDVPGLKLDVWG